MLTGLRRELHSLANPEKAKIVSRFFKTGKGEYGEGDEFLGVMVPEQRKIAKKYLEMNFTDIKKLLDSKIHEERLIALLLLVERFKKSGKKEKAGIIDYYLRHTMFVNNWDLVDLSAHQLLGEYILGKPEKKKTLLQLAKSGGVWERRISVIATYAFIKKNRFEETLEIAGLLLNDEHDLIQKAVGWMLREVGKRNQAAEETFLKKHFRKMPRTMLRYAIERLPKKKRLEYLKK